LYFSPATSALVTSRNRVSKTFVHYVFLVIYSTANIPKDGSITT